MNWNSILQLSEVAHKDNLDHINLLWRAIMSMDIIEIYTLLHDNIQYNGYTRIEFVKVIDSKFKKHRDYGDTQLYLDLLECPKCHKNKIICSFIGTESFVGFSLYFEIENSEIISIDTCSFYGDIENI